MSAPDNDKPTFLETIDNLVRNMGGTWRVDEKTKDIIIESQIVIEHKDPPPFDFVIDTE